MSMKQRFCLKQKSNQLVISCRQFLLFKFGLAMILAFSLISPSFAQASGYYETPESGRPRGAFSICCCKKINGDNSQASYTCSFVDTDACPADTKPYKANNLDCPRNLIFTRYAQQ